jgi:hypothetical protein
VRVRTRCVNAPSARVYTPTRVYAPTPAYKQVCVNAASGAYTHLYLRIRTRRCVYAGTRRTSCMRYGSAIRASRHEGDVVLKGGVFRAFALIRATASEHVWVDCGLSAGLRLGPWLRPSRRLLAVVRRDPRRSGSYIIKNHILDLFPSRLIGRSGIWICSMHGSNIGLHR